MRSTRQAGARNLALFLALASLSPAAELAGEVSSSGDFFVSGRRVQLSGQPSWPVREGDVVSTGSAPARFRAVNGAEVLMQANSSIQMARDTEGMLMRFLNGELAYRLAEPIVGLPQEGVVTGSADAARVMPAAFAPRAAVNTASAFRDPLAASEVALPPVGRVEVPAPPTVVSPLLTSNNSPTSLLSQTLNLPPTIFTVRITTRGGFVRFSTTLITVAPNPAAIRQAQTEKKEK